MFLGEVGEAFNFSLLLNGFFSCPVALSQLLMDLINFNLVLDYLGHLL